MIPKFRAWDENGKIMNSVVSIDFETKEATNGGDIFKLENIELMQSTGLKDKNSVEIFEGDIIKLQEGHTSYYVVEWHKKGMWVFRYIENKDQYYPFDLVYSFSDHIRNEVIGNRFENPELLEVE